MRTQGWQSLDKCAGLREPFSFWKKEKASPKRNAVVCEIQSLRSAGVQSTFSLGKKSCTKRKLGKRTNPLPCMNLFFWEKKSFTKRKPGEKERPALEKENGKKGLHWK